jgi:hypothetical protein
MIAECQKWYPDGRHYNSSECSVRKGIAISRTLPSLEASGPALTGRFVCTVISNK